MSRLDDDLSLALGLLAVCDALEAEDDAEAHKKLAVARKRAHAIVSRYGTHTESSDSDEDQKGQDQ